MLNMSNFVLDNFNYIDKLDFLIKGITLKTIGLLGGMSWESTDLYYQQINKMVQMKLGKLHSAKVVLISVDFAEIEELQHKGSGMKLDFI
jgi:hypothetical protein